MLRDTDTRTFRKLTYHVISKTRNDKTEKEPFPINSFQSNVVVRSTDCIMLIDKCSPICEKCNKLYCHNGSKTKKSRKTIPARANALLMNAGNDKVVLALKENR